MVKLREWTNQEKSQMVLEGIKGRTVIDLCLEHQISQSMHYSWRDQLSSQKCLNVTF
jgi:transposase-like protein